MVNDLESLMGKVELLLGEAAELKSGARKMFHG